MAEYEVEERYEGNGGGGGGGGLDSDTHPYASASSPQPHDRAASKSHRESRDYDRESSRSREKERDKERKREKERSRDRDRDRDGEKERDHHHRDRHRERKERGRDRDRDGDDDYHRSREHDRRRDYDREERRKRRSRSASPSRDKTEPDSRSRSRSKSKRMSGFDMAPPPSAMLAGAAAVTGQITAPNPAIPGMLQNMFPLATGQMQPFSALPVMPIQAMTQQATRHARRVYVGGLPPTANEQSVAIFFSQVMAKIGGNTAGPGDAVVNVYINHDKKFAFVEMRSVEEASNAMALDGIIFEGAPVKVRRPTDYNPSLAATLGPSQPNPNLNLGAVGLTPGSAGGLEGPDRIFVGGLPYYFTETQIRELLETFGPLRGFDLVKDRETGNSKGYAFCVYQDLAVTDIACAALNGIKMGDKTLTVRRANQGTNQPKPEQESILMHAQQQIALQKLIFQPALVATKVVCLTQAVSADELKEDEDYEEIIDDMRQECSKFGTLVNVVIPRPQPDGDMSGGVGKVFLEYADIEGATKARTGLNGRKFGGNQVVDDGLIIAATIAAEVVQGLEPEDDDVAITAPPTLLLPASPAPVAQIGCEPPPNHKEAQVVPQSRYLFARYEVFKAKRTFELDIEKYIEQDRLDGVGTALAIEDFMYNWYFVDSWFEKHKREQLERNKRLLTAPSWRVPQRSITPAEWVPEPAPTPPLAPVPPQEPEPVTPPPSSTAMVTQPSTSASGSASALASQSVVVPKEVSVQLVEDNKKFKKFMEATEKHLEASDRKQDVVTDMLHAILDRLPKP